jgi:hypothetical protein
VIEHVREQVTSFKVNEIIVKIIAFFPKPIHTILTENKDNEERSVSQDDKKVQFEEAQP